jgi:hypothetical protein
MMPGVTGDPVELAIGKYREILFQMADLDGDKGHTSHTRQWNRLVDRLQAQRLLVQSSPHGQSAITALLDDPRPTVRAWAAGAALFWDEPRARPVLEELRDSPANYGLHSVSARYTLIEFDAGHLNPSWEPPHGQLESDRRGTTQRGRSER